MSPSRTAFPMGCNLGAVGNIEMGNKLVDYLETIRGACISLYNLGFTAMRGKPVARSTP